jgi:hypothetical protein
MGLRRLLVPLLVAAALAHAEDASGACASAVVVDGRVLFGAVVQHPRRLPPRDGEHEAIVPACNDTGGDEPDQRTTVLRLRGLPPRIAVAERGGSGAVYVDPGSLVATGTHPLHAALFGSPRKPSYVDAATRFTNARPTNPCATASACGSPPRTAVSAEWRIV